MRQARFRQIVLMALALSLAAMSPTVTPGQDLPETEGRLLVVNQGADSLMIFEEPAHRLLATVKVGRDAREVAVTPDGRKAYVSNFGSQSVAVVDLDTYKVIKTIGAAGFQAPHGLQVTPDGRWLLVTSEGNRRLVLIDARRDVVARSVTTSQRGSHLIAMTVSGRQAYVANGESDTVSLVRLPELRLQHSIKIGSGPEGIAAAPNGRLIVVALQGSGQVALLDTGTDQVVARLPVGQTPIRVAFVPRSFTALVVNRDSDDVTVLDVLSRKVTRTVRVGQRPGGVVTNARGTRGYVANGDSGTVSVFSIPGYEVKEEIRVGTRPVGLAFVPPPHKRGGRHAASGPPGGRA